MSECRIHQDINLFEIANEYAERVSRVIDEQTLANVEHQLAEYDYVKVVRCRDCMFSRIHDGKRYPGKKAKGRMYCINWGEMLNDWTKPDGFCHRAKRKEGGE